MAAVTVCSDFGAEENIICHCFHFFPIYLPWNDGATCHDLVFWMLSFKPAFSLLSFTFIKKLFSYSLLYAIRLVSSAYLRMLIFLLEVLIPDCHSWFQMLCLIPFKSCSFKDINRSIILKYWFKKLFGNYNLLWFWILFYECLCW